MKLRIKQSLLCCIALLAVSLSAAEEKSAGKSLFFDQENGGFDVSGLLATSAGFLPVPLVITEPAVGYGAGAALLFFHGSIADAERKQKAAEAQGKKARLIPPSISGVLGFGTENGTWGAGGFHMGHWKNDSIRYLGGLIYADVNLGFYGRPESERPEINYNLQSAIFFQQLLFRLGESDFFLGGEYLLANTDTRLDVAIEGWPTDRDNITESGLGLLAQYDTRDNTFTPNSGTKTELKFNRFDQAIGSETDYNKGQFKSLLWVPVHKKVVAGFRLDTEFSNGDIPFYMLPFIQLRGIPALRYQGAYATTVETEWRWDINPRWSAVGFLGCGWVADFEFNDYSDSDTYPAGGAGFRYLIASDFKMRVGVDVARGPEDTAFYLTVGSHWQ